MLLLLPAVAQTRAELDSTYGQAVHNVYQIRPGIAAAVTFSDNGKVKEFRIFSNDPNSKNALLRIDAVRAVIRELVPGRTCRPLSYAQIDSPCPPRNGCKGHQEVHRTLTTLVVWYKDAVAYALVTMSDKPIAPPGDMKLLPGYEHVPHCGIDTAAGVIKKVGGIKIIYDIGSMAGNFARRYANSGIAEWTRTEQVDGDSVLIVLTKQKYIVATFEKANANFTALIGSQSDIDDFLKMVLTYHPKK